MSTSTGNSIYISDELAQWMIDDSDGWNGTDAGAHFSPDDSATSPLPPANES